MPETDTSNEPGPRGSAAPGCFILAAIVTVFGGLVILYVAVFLAQKKAYGNFTQEKPAEIATFQPSEEQIKQLNDKLFAIRAATSQNKQERIILTADDMNTLLATAEILEDFRGNTYIEAITRRGIETRMAQPLKKMPFSDDRRYLNATFIFQPELRRRTIALRVRDIIADVGSIPEKFVQNYDAIGFFKLDPENPNIKPHVRKLRRIYTEPGHIVIETGEPAGDEPLPYD